MNKSAYGWFYLAILSLGIGGGFAFLVAMSRTPFGYKYFPPYYMYHALAGHVVLAILLWLLSFTVVLWDIYLGNGDNIRFRGLSHKIALMGPLLVTISVVTGNGKVVTNNYVPTIIDPLFFIGLALFITGFSINAIGYLKKSIRYLFSKDILMNTVVMSLLISLLMILSMVCSILLNRGPAEPLVFFERLFWTTGHIQQILNGSMLIIAWYSLLRKHNGEFSTWRLLRYANVLLLLSALFIFGLQFIYDPLNKASKVAAEITYAVGLGIPVFLHIANIIRNLKRSEFGVAYVALLLSMIIYTFGIAIAYGGFANDLRVPAHYHGAVTSLTLALMGLSYYIIRDMRQRVYGEHLARYQPAIYGGGMFLFILGLFISGAFGAPRKTYGIAFTSDPVVLASLTIMGVGTILAVIGGIIFVSYISVTIVKGGRKYGLSE
ncbi:MAG: cbb3-type cytochrome c oxidase subunit I [Nitrospirae bacterium]|nr:cbb3-type cytochrome c oxidase subunit I [Nitrospirota bacterium]